MRNTIIRYKWKLAGVLLGALAGFAYWYFIGCSSGTCPIQSQWQNSTLYGGLIGLVLAKGPSKEKNTGDKNENVPDEKALDKD